MTKRKRLLCGILSASMILTVLSGPVPALGEPAPEEGTGYYVCFSDQNYAVRAANKMELSDSGDYYVLSDVSMNGSRGFYVADNAGTRYYGADNGELYPEEAGTYSYDILFSPDSLYTDPDSGAEDTGCHVSYRFHQPYSYTLSVGGTDMNPVYNPYQTDYDLYVISSVYLTAGQTVVYEDESHSIPQSGYYRILFTPGKLREGGYYAFSKDGEFGSGDGFNYHIYIEDALRYFVVFENAPEGLVSDTQISGSPACLLQRWEENIAGEEYRSGRFFLPGRDTELRYRIYEEGISGGYRLIDDDNDGDTDISKLTPADAGWYTLSFTVSGDGFLTDCVWDPVRFGGFYAVGGFNRGGFNENGGVDISGKFRFTKIEKDDPDYEDDYTEDYGQYILYLNVSQGDLADGDLEFVISDGEKIYRDGDHYIRLNTPGRYKILFSEEHVYGADRNYRYTLLQDETQTREIEIYTTGDFLSFAADCNASADYSVGLSVWLSADLDFEGVEFVPVKSFSGHFYGSSHEMKNITLKKSGQSEICGVFERVNRSGSVERLRVTDLTLDCDETGYVGFVARNYGSIKKVSVSGTIAGKQTVGGIAGLNGQSVVDDDSSTVDSGDTVQPGVILDCENQARITGEVCVGGIAGISTGEITGSRNSGDVIPAAKRSGSSLQSIGGIAGYSAGEVCDCMNSGGVGQKDGANYVGGICGLCTGEVYFSDNTGEIAGSRYTGGAVGYFGSLESGADGEQDTGTMPPGFTVDDLLQNYFPQEEDRPVLSGDSVYAMAYLTNRGSVTSGSYAGGICGCSGVSQLTLMHAVSTGEVETLVGDYAGGIIGASEGAAVAGCVSSGSVQSHGNYAGGIGGLCVDVVGCLSACDVKGADYVGGIAGQVTGSLTSCYTNVLILPGDGAENTGSIAGFADAFNPSLNSFEGKVQYNYYVSGAGGIGGVSYGRSFDDAAAAIDSEKLAFPGMLSPDLHEYFSHTYFVGGADGMHYPAPYFLTVEADDLPGCGDGDGNLPETLFDAHAQDYAGLVSDCTAVSYVFTLMEWNKDNGDLYDDEGNLLTDHFEVTQTVRVHAGGKVEEIRPVYAVLSDGKYRYEGDEADYFVYFDLPETVTGNVALYARYREIARSLSAADGAVLAEGEFVSGTVMELVPAGQSYTLRFTLDGQEIAVGPVTLKYRVSGEIGQYEVCTVSGDRITPVESSAAGEYLSFSWTDGDYFLIRQNLPADPPVWAVALISGGGVLILCGAAALIVRAAVKRKK